MVHLEDHIVELVFDKASRFWKLYCFEAHSELGDIFDFATQIVFRIGCLHSLVRLASSGNLTFLSGVCSLVTIVGKLLFFDRNKFTVRIVLYGLSLAFLEFDGGLGLHLLVRLRHQKLV